MSGERNSLIGDTPQTWRDKLFTPKFVLGMWTLMNFWTYFDRGAISASLSNVKASPDIAGAEGVLSDAQAGAIGSAFMVGFFLTCPIFAALGGTFTAKQIITAGLIVWALACVSTGLSQDYWMIVISRCFVGVGEAAYAGYTVTIIDNMAPPASRTMWIGLFYSMIPVGTAIGMTAGGIVSSKVTLPGGYAGWRIVFLAEIIPMIPIIIGNAMLPVKYNPVKETEVAAAAETADPEEAETGAQGRPKDDFITLPKAIKMLATNLSYICLVFGYAMYTFVLGAISIWAISMLEQGPLHLDAVASSLFMGGTVCITGLAGSICGGLFVDKLGGSQGDKGVLQCCKYNVLMVTLSLPLGFIAMSSSNVWVFGSLFIVGVFLLFSVTAPITAAMLSVVPSPLRTYSVSFSVFFMHMLGDFPSPLIAGEISDKFSGGCDSLTLAGNTTCMGHNDCRWIPKKGVEDASCVNIYQLRNALLCVWAFIFLAIPAWGSVGIRMYRKVKGKEEEFQAHIDAGHTSIQNVSQCSLRTSETVPY